MWTRRTVIIGVGISWDQMQGWIGTMQVQIDEIKQSRDVRQAQ